MHIERVSRIILEPLTLIECDRATCRDCLTAFPHSPQLLKCCPTMADFPFPKDCPEVVKDWAVGTIAGCFGSQQGYGTKIEC